MGLELNQLRELALPEVAVGKLRMRNGQARLGDCAVAVPHDVEVQRARPPSRVALTTVDALDLEEMGEEITGRQRCLDSDHLIEIGILAGRADGRGLLDVALAHEA